MRRVQGSRGPRVPVAAWTILLVAAAAVGAELNFSADVDRTTVGLGEQFQLTVTVEGSNMGNVPRPQLPALDDFTQLGSTSSQSTNISFVNGRMSQQQTIAFIYFLSPKKLGELTIGPCRIDFKGAMYQTQPIAITVSKESQAPAPPQQQQPQMPGFPQPRQRAGGTSRGGVHLLASADRTSVYQGEQVTVAFSLYSQVQIGNLSIKDMPGFTGFWSEKMFDAKELNWRSTTYQGQRYSSALLKQVALFPTQSGELKVDKMTLNGSKVIPGGFFFDQTESFEVSSDPITIRVKPLPDAGRPADFCGGVGDFKLSAALSKDSSTNGEPITLSIKVTGTGNVGLVGEPQVSAPPGVKLLAPEAKQNAGTSGERISGSRTFDFPLIPQADGQHVISPVGMSFFNPKTGSYYTLSSEPLSFIARGASSASAAVDAQQGVRVLGSDIVHIKPASGRAAQMPADAGWFFYPAGIVVLGTGLLLGRHRRKLEQDRGYARLSRSSRLVKKGLAEASRLLAAGNERDFYAALNRAVVSYAGDRFNIEASGMTGEELQRHLLQNGVATDTVAALLELIASCDAARFSPGMVRCGPKETLEKARIVLEKI